MTEQQTVLLGSPRVAEILEIKPNTWYHYVASGYAPEPDYIDTLTGKKYWTPATIEGWRARRRGRGRRLAPAQDGQR